MRIFQDRMEAAKEIERDLKEMGVLVKGDYIQSKYVGPDGWTKELIGYSYSVPIYPLDIKNWEDLLEWFGWTQSDTIRRLTIYRNLEFIQRIRSWSNPGNAWEYRREYWEHYLEENNKFSYTYGERMRWRLVKIINLLRIDKETRQAIISIWHDDPDSARIGSQRRIPCSMYYQFLCRQINLGERKYKLDILYNMRSCDFYNHFLFDQTWAIELGYYVADKIGAEFGRLIHQIGSLHAYHNDMEKRGTF